MRRNLFIIIGVFLAIIFLTVTGNIIVIGQKIAVVTHVWWTEYVFYALLAALTVYYILWPFIRIQRAPQLPVMRVTDDESTAQLTDFGRLLARNCSYLSDENANPDKEVRQSLRKEHSKQLSLSLQLAANDAGQLREIIQKELDIRFKGNKELGVMGINRRIQEWAKSVFMITAISQNSRFDMLSVMYLNVRMISDIISASGFRPSNRQLFRIYGTVLTTALITYSVSEALTVSGSVAPFDFGDLGSTADVDEDALVDAAADGPDIDVADSSDGFSLYSVLRRIRIPGIVLSAAIDGTLNALITLRIGYITKSYLQQGSAALSGIKNKRLVKRQAMVDAIAGVPAVIAAGSGIIGKRTAQFMIRLIKREKPDTSFFKNLKHRIFNANA